MNPQPSPPLPAGAPAPGHAAWSWHERTLLALRQRLLAAQAEHEQAVTAALETRSIDAAETAQEVTDHEVILAELHAEAERLTEIDAALQRIAHGTYGVCEETGERIAPARLRAIPWTRYSRAAAERHEQRARPGGPHA